ncbi:uncharacterized protein [Prorops nasuta]|uniref:uncharacterized protein n=1 Tax=Prorops nasuta TaxID=863751 RepID=UPI0034CD7F4B
MDFTFKDLYVSLKMIQIAREKQEENLIALFNNNKTVASIEAISVEELEVKQQIYQNCLVEEVRSEDPKDFPMPKSVDAQLQAIKGLEIEVSAMRKLLKRTNDRLNSIKEDKFFLEKKRLGLKKMKQACLSVIENDGNQTYDKEIRITKHIFKQVKTDLNAVVEKLFPRNERMKDFLAVSRISLFIKYYMILCIAG